jgi:colanic acid/amylovoran biosynthesis glycosyltransferase
MKVALVVSRFPKGSETFIVSKFVGLLDKGFDVCVVCNASPMTERQRFPQFQSRFNGRVFVNWPTSPHWIVPLLFPFLLLRLLAVRPALTLRYLRRGFARFGPRVLKYVYLDAQFIRSAPQVVHFEFGALAVDRTYLGDLLGCKIVVSFRGYDLNYVGLDNPAFYLAVWNEADHLHLLGEDLWRRARQRGCPPDKPHSLIPPAADLMKFQPGPRAADVQIGTVDRPLRLLSVGRLEWKKGYEYALQSVRQLCDLGLSVEYRIVGDGEYLQPLAFCRHQLALEHCVTFTGGRPHDEIAEHMRWADVFLHSAVSEGFCNAVIEAQAMELPVVTSDADGLRENVANGATGFVVGRRCPDAMAEKVRLLAGDPALRRQMGEAGRQHVTQHFTLERQIDAFSALYEHVARGA